MKNYEDAIGTFFTNNHRYIKYDGSGFYSGKLKSIFERANFNAGAMAVVALSIFDYLSQSDLTTIAPQTYNDFIRNAGIFGGLMLFAQKGVLISKLAERFASDELKERAKKSIFNKAIDTTGRSLSKSEISLNEIEMLNTQRTFGNLAPVLFVPIAYFGLSHIYGSEGAVIHHAMVYANETARSFRAHKLLLGHLGQGDGYVFMDEPPAQVQKEKKTSLSFGGLTNPTP